MSRDVEFFLILSISSGIQNCPKAITFFDVMNATPKRKYYKIVNCNALCAQRSSSSPVLVKWTLPVTKANVEIQEDHNALNKTVKLMM